MGSILRGSDIQAKQVSEQMGIIAEVDTCRQLAITSKHVAAVLTQTHLQQHVHPHSRIE